MDLPLLTEITKIYDALRDYREPFTVSKCQVTPVMFLVNSFLGVGNDMFADG